MHHGQLRYGFGARSRCQIGGDCVGGGLVDYATMCVVCRRSRSWVDLECVNSGAYLCDEFEELIG